MRKPVVAAVVLFSLSLSLLWRARPDGDVAEFSRYGHAVLDGQIPYRDFALEYPPGAIAAFTPPAFGEYVTWFRIENALAWIAVIVLSGALLDAIRPRDRWNWIVLAAIALTPVILGPFVLMRFDAWPTALVLGSLLALFRRRPTVAMLLLAAAVLVKAWPLALLPLVVLYGVPKRALVLFAVVLIAVLLPFAALSPGGAYNGLRVQPDRHLEYETIGASALFVLDRPVRLYFETGSYSVAGSGANAIGAVQSALQLAMVALIAVLFARSRRGRPQLLNAAATTVASAAVVGKVLSPQFLLWIAPFAALTDLTALALFLAACACTRGLFLSSFRSLVELRTAPVALLAVRNLLLVATVAVLTRVAWQRR
jgi:Glycosyltransferase family 87